MLGHNTPPCDVVNIPLQRQEDFRFEVSTVYITEYGWSEGTLERAHMETQQFILESVSTTVRNV